MLSTVDASSYVLVVDDDESICEVIAEVLRDEGYDVTAARDAARALRMIEQCPPSVILLDLSLGERRGEELVKAIRRLPGHTTSIIVVSAHTDVQKRAEEVGADGFVAKPFDIPILLETVQAVLSVRAGRDESGLGGAGIP